MADRFPKDCWEKKCPHFHYWDMSIDDYTCFCDLLNSNATRVMKILSILCARFRNQGDGMIMWRKKNETDTISRHCRTTASYTRQI